MPVFCSEVFPERQDPVEERIRWQGLRDCVAKLNNRVLGCLEQVVAVTQWRRGQQCDREHDNVCYR